MVMDMSSHIRRDELRGAAANHIGCSVGSRPRDDGRHHRSVRHPQASQPVDPKLAVHHSINTRSDLRSARGVAKAGRGGAREINQVLPALRLWAWNDFRVTHLVKGGLTAKLPGHLDRLHNRVEVMIRRQVIRVNYGCITPVRTR